MYNMMFLSGLFSVFQIVLLPGIILLKLFGTKTEGFIQRSLYAFGLSLFANYIIVSFLTWLRLYNPIVIYSLFSIEVTSLIYLLVKDKRDILSSRTVKDYYLLMKNYISPLHTGYKICFLISCVLLIFFISLIPVNAGTSYYFIDALNHWTRWPVQWASNRFPSGTGHYPQLFPANLSLIYVFTGEPEFQFFTKAIMPLFFMGNLLIFFDLSIIRKSRADLTGLIIYGMILLVFYSVLFILEVNADIPVSFFSFLTFYTIICEGYEGFEVKKTLLVIIFATSAALTKLAGLYILTCAGIWIFYNFYINRRDISFRLILKTMVYTLLILSGSIFWYLVRPVEMLKGLDQSPYLQAGYYIRFISAIKMLTYTLGLPLLLFLTVTIAASFFSKETKHIILFIIVPSVILWAFFFSADYRNLSFAIPFIAYASGYGVWEIYNRIVPVKKVKRNTISKIPFSGNQLLFSLFMAACLVLGYLFAASDLVFNIGIKSAYFVHGLFSNNYRLTYFTEIGYYKYVEFILTAFRLLCVILLVMFVLRNLRVRFSHLVIAVSLISIIAGISILKKEKMWEMQVHDKEMVKVHNIYYKVYTFINRPEQRSLIMANNSLFSELIPPFAVEFQYYKDINSDTINQQNQKYARNYLLLEKSRLTKETLLYLSNKKLADNFNVCFEDEEYIFLLKRT